MKRKLLSAPEMIQYLRGRSAAATRDASDFPDNPGARAFWERQADLMAQCADYIEWSEHQACRDALGANAPFNLNG